MTNLELAHLASELQTRKERIETLAAELAQERAAVKRLLGLLEAAAGAGDRELAGAGHRVL